MLFMVVGSFLMTNLFVGVIIENFNRLKTEKETELAGDLLQSESQRAWGLTQQMLLQVRWWCGGGRQG